MVIPLNGGSWGKRSFVESTDAETFCILGVGKTRKNLILSATMHCFESAIYYPAINNCDNPPSHFHYKYVYSDKVLKFSWNIESYMNKCTYTRSLFSSASYVSHTHESFRRFFPTLNVSPKDRFMVLASRPNESGQALKYLRECPKPSINGPVSDLFNIDITTYILANWADM